MGLRELKLPVICRGKQAVDYPIRAAFRNAEARLGNAPLIFYQKCRNILNEIKTVIHVEFCYIRKCLRTELFSTYGKYTEIMNIICY